MNDSNVDITEYDPWADNDNAHYALMEAIQTLDRRLLECEQTLKAVKAVSEDLVRRVHNM